MGLFEEESDTLRYLHKKLGENMPNVSYSWIQDPKFGSNQPHDKTLRKIFDDNSDTRGKTFLKKNQGNVLQSDKMSK